MISGKPIVITESNLILLALELNVNTPGTLATLHKFTQMSWDTETNLENYTRNPVNRVLS